VKIRTIVDRPGAPQGSVIELPEAKAVALIWRGLAVPMYAKTGR